MLASDIRPWGSWEEYLNEPGYRVKRIIVTQGRRLSLQKHHHRSEHWVIVQGEGKFTLEDSDQTVRPGDHVFIPVEAAHRIENTGQQPLIFVETQLGECVEEDVVRIQDDWGRS